MLPINVAFISEMCVDCVHFDIRMKIRLESTYVRETNAERKRERTLRGRCESRKKFHSQNFLPGRNQNLFRLVPILFEARHDTSTQSSKNKYHSSKISFLGVWFKVIKTKLFLIPIRVSDHDE